MALASGTRLGPYGILSPIGAGGMGEVYRARDSRLTRTVAIKVLPPLLSSDERFKQRFELDVGTQDGISFLVTEVAQALQKAHSSGFVHRDLKPSNIMLTKTGAKLMDFGLAKSAQVDMLSSPSAATLTASKTLTAEGNIVGTLQYMSPEQLEGREADGRSDVFALGAVLYEMLTGCQAFAGKSRASVIAAILTSEPPPIS